MQIGGFQPPTDPRTSWFGAVNLCAPGESWPEFEGAPMWPLAQLVLSQLPFRPPRLDDLAVITVFVGPHQLPRLSAPNGEGWCLRAYGPGISLVPLAAPPIQAPVRPFPLRPIVVEEDYPMHEDVPRDVWPLVDQLEQTEGSEYYDCDFVKTADGLKLGGWPSLIQSEIFWAPNQAHPARPEFVFQIDSTEKGNWGWGHGGVGYFGRGTRVGERDTWALEWQCY